VGRWIPGDDEEESALLAELGLSSADELFQDIPPRARIPRLGLGRPRTESEIVFHVESRLRKNRTDRDLLCFLGGPLRDRYVPALVDGILQRSEFYTSYTPYQAEASQGLLQALFEFQSLWVELTNMEVANSSLYDGGTAVGEAALMARRLRGGKRFLVPENLWWETRSILENYLRGHPVSVESIPVDPNSGEMDLDTAVRRSRDDCFGLLIEYPDSWGLLQRGLDGLKSRLGDVPLVVSTDPLALTLLEPPGSWGADIVVGEGQGLGMPVSYGGPLLGLIAGRRRDLRALPGRLVGASVDAEGRRAFTLTLQTREQHIRRSRATSNICTNQALMALAFTVYCTLLGPRELADLARQEVREAHRLAERLSSFPQLRAPRFALPYFNRFVLGLEGLTPPDFLGAMARHRILAGSRLEDPRRGDPSSAFPGILVAPPTTGATRAIERYVQATREVLSSGGKSP
jgi:glycine dehydrogenase subunit 1